MSGAAKPKRTKIERFELTTSQLQSLLNVAARGNPKIARSVGSVHEIRLQQTRSDVGGRHTYVEVVGEPGEYLHLARNGKPTAVGGEIK